MNSTVFSRRGIINLSVIGVLLSNSVAPLRAQQASETLPFDTNDVSFLWPVPTSPDDVKRLISMADSCGPDGKEQIWDKQLFDQVIEMAVGHKLAAKGINDPFSIDFADGIDPIKTELKSQHTWKVAGIRFNPSSLGAEESVRMNAGIIPGIRLVAQPVTVTDGKVRVHDYAAHVVFNFINEVKPPFTADEAAVKEIIKDLRELRDLAAKSSAATKGVPLGVHPALAKKVGPFEDKLKQFVSKHVSKKRFQVVSFMGISPPEPWIFFSVVREPDKRFEPRSVGGFGRPGTPGLPLAQMFITFPFAEITVTPPPKAQPNGFGLSTALLFEKNRGGAIDLAKSLELTAAPDSLKAATIRDLPDMIANPKLLNTLSTDCVSCHTEHSRRVELGTNKEGKNSAFAFKIPDGISDVHPDLLQQRPSRNRGSVPSWNTRNFGWFPGLDKPSISRRAANEAVESTILANELLKKISQPPTTDGP